MSSEQAFHSMSDLLKILLDEIAIQADTYVAVNVLLLSSTFYYNPATMGGTNQKHFLYEQISDHGLWLDCAFWEKAITQQIQKDMATQQELQRVENEKGLGETWEDLPAEEKLARGNEVVFAILSSLQQEMLTYNLDKSMIKSLVKKICSTMTLFPENYTVSMLVTLFRFNFLFSKK